MATQAHLSPDPDQPRRVLIVRVGAMGDVLHAMPAVAALRRLHPGWHIGWVVEPAWMPLLQTTSDRARPVDRGPAMPLVDRVSFASTKAWKRRPFSWETVRDISALRQELRSERFDLCVDMQGSIRSAVIGRMAGAKKFVGPEKPREAQAGLLYAQRVTTAATHVVEQGCELLGGAVGEVLTPARVALPVDESAEQSCDALLTWAQARGERFIVIAPTAGWGAKQWPPERYGAVAAELGRTGHRVLVNATASGHMQLPEAPIKDPVADAVVRASHGYATSLPCNLSQLIALLRRASLVIAGDTGPLHLAAALEIPVVGLYGPTDPARNGPYNTLSRILRHSSSQRDHSRHPETEQGLMQITVEEVTAAALDLLRTEQGKVKL